MANTTNLNLEKPIGTDQALVSVINSNMDKIDTFAGSTNQALSTLQENPYNGHRTNTSTDLDNEITVGLVQVNTSTANAPFTGYGICEITSTNLTDAGNKWIWQKCYRTNSADIFVRNKTGNSAWTPWKLIVTNVLDTASMHINRGNYASFTFSGLNAINDSSIYKHGLLIWGVGAESTDNGMSVIFIDTTGTVTIKNVTGSGRTFTGQVNSDGSLTITANAVVYGGLKLIWLT